MANTRIIAEPGMPQVVITREFDAPRELLFRAHTDPGLLARWLGPEWLSTTVDYLDARHGGQWRYTQRDAAGEAHSFHGLYHGDPTPERIVQTYEYDRQPGVVFLNLITFAQHHDKTLLRQVTVFASVEARDGYVEAGMEDGARASMDRLDALVCGLAGSDATIEEA
jgi:uncharacterized protein YndB with AHSA1/START domain